MSTVLRFTDDELRAEIERLLRQLPEGMKHCTIVFRECALGHGWLTATNWVPFECPTCAIQAERARADRYLAAITEMIDAESQAHNATAPVPPAVLRYLAALESIRAIVEEARRG